MKCLLLAILLITANGYAGEDKSCEARLIDADLYYGAFLRGLEVQKLNDQHLAEAIASVEPFDPVAIVTRDPRNGAMKETFAKLLRNETVRAQWPETVERLRALQEKRKGLAGVQAEAARATQKVLAAAEYLPLGTQHNSLSIITLLDGRHAVAHIEGAQKAVVTDLGTRTEIFSVDVSDKLKGTVKAYVSWYSDKSGKPGLYLATKDNGRNSQLYRMSPGAVAFEPVEFKEGTGLAVTGFDSRVPGTLVLKTKDGWSSPVLFELSGSSPPRKLGSPRYVDDGGDWAMNGPQLVTPGILSFKLAKVFHTSQDLLWVKHSTGNVDVAWKGQKFALRVPFVLLNNPACAVVEESPGHVLIALSYVHPTQSKRDVTIYDLSNAALWESVWTVEGSTPIEIPGQFSASMEWIHDPHGNLLVAVNEHTTPDTTLSIVDPGKSDSVTLNLNSQIDAWFEFGGEVYYTLRSRNVLYKLYSSGDGK